MTLPVAILAGGLATRLHPLTEIIPKSLIDVAGKPFIVHQLALLRRYGLTCVVLCVGHLGDLIRDTLGDGSDFGVDLHYVFDGPTLLGTGGALRGALPLLGEAFFVLYGDSYLECDYAAIEQTFWQSGKMGLMTVLRNNDRWDRSNVLFRGDRIEHYDKRDRIPGMRHVDYGLGGLRAEVFAPYPPNRPLDLAAIYQDLLARDQLAAVEVHQRFYEIGSLAGLAETRQYLADKEMENA